LGTFAALLKTMKLFYRKKTHSGGSLSAESWKRLKRNPFAMTALFYILFVVLIAIAGYLITPDKTPYANRQLLEINGQKPGFSVNLLKVRKNEPLEKAGFLRAAFAGRHSEYSYIPISNYRIEGSKIFITEFSPDAVMPEREISLANVLYPVDDSSPQLHKNGYTTFTDVHGQQHKLADSEMSERIVAGGIEKQRYLLGTDPMGRDLLSRMIIGARVSISVGFISISISLILGIFLGAVSGYFRGWVDALVMWLINVIWSIPSLLLVIAITFALGKGFWQIFIAVGLTMWVEVARVVRGQVLSIREKEYVEAARALGFGHTRIIFRHILPNVMAPVIVISAANFASAILLEAGLSFLGIGVQPPMPSWGSMIKDHYGYLNLDQAYLAILPGLAIMLLVLSFLILGNGLRDAMDVKVS